MQKKSHVGENQLEAPSADVRDEAGNFFRDEN